jgi:hypothetical protein
VMVSTRGDSHIHRIESLSLTFWNPRSIRVIDVLDDPTSTTRQLLPDDELENLKKVVGTQD